jgi:predicted O-methyltransferase YrrM
MVKSSYKEHNYAQVFQTLVFSINPRLIVEFGILDGYSLKALASSASPSCQIDAYDLFDEFPYNAADFKSVNQTFSPYTNVKIHKGDFYGSQEIYQDKTIDILHVDIANNGEVYEYAIENYLPKLTNQGVCVLEGGSHQRDRVDWMLRYNKPKIVPILEKYKTECDIIVLEDYPSLTLIKKKNEKT